MNLNNPVPEGPVPDTCRYCGSTRLRIEYRFEVRRPGSYSLAGVQMKFSGRKRLCMICDNCGHVSRGEPV